MPTVSKPTDENIADRLQKLSAAKRALLQRRIGTARLQNSTVHIPRVPRDKPIRASFSQERMWLNYAVNPDSIAYNSQVALHFSGPLDVAALRRTIHELVHRHEAGRLTLHEQHGVILQRIQEAAVADLREVDIENSLKSLREWIDEIIARPFTLDNGPLVRWTLLRVGPLHHTLILSDHHAVTDGWSRRVIFREMMELYDHFHAGKDGTPLAPKQIDFADFAEWQRTWIDSPEGIRQLKYWQTKLAGLPTIELPLDRPRPAQPTYRGAHEVMTFSGEEMRMLSAIADREGATMFMVFLAGFFTLLQRYSHAEEICVGSGIANRRMPETDGIVGMLINTVVLRADFTGNPTFREFLGRVRSLTLEAYAHQEAPFDRVVGAVRPNRDPSMNPLHQVTFNFQNNPMPAPVFDDVSTVLERPLFNGSAKYDLYVAGWPQSNTRLGDWQRDDEAVLLSWEYNRDIFDQKTILLLQDQLRALLRHAAASPETRIGDLSLGEQQTSVAPQAVHPVPACEVVHELFAAWACRTPESIAVECGDRKITYGELHANALRLAHRILEASFGGERIAVLARRTPNIICALLGILNAGSAYVPIDPDLPPARIKGLLKSLGVKAIVGEADDALFAVKFGLTFIAVHASSPEASASPALPSPDAASPAYVLFTSGSTGEPMTVAVPHRAIARLVTNQTFASMSSQEKWLLHSPLSFDASTLEIWAPLCNGGSLALISTEGPSLHEIGEAIRRHAVTSLWLTAGLFKLAAAESPEIFDPLRQLLTGGDIVPTDAVRKIMARHPSLRIVNGYGPTENTTFTCCSNIEPADLDRRSIPIGIPVRGTTVFVLDATGRRCATGIPGELCAGGQGLAIGYLNSERATQERFIEHPEFGRLYRTGDLCRVLPDGRIEFLGRKDRQIKVSGVRIEPSEVEHALTQCRGVLAAAVSVRTNQAGMKSLAAFVVPTANEQTFSLDVVRSDLAAILQRFAIPSFWSVIPKLPLTSNGKTDYSALERVEEHQASLDRPLHGETEKVIASIWDDVLGIRALSASADFFSIGGHSLAALQVLAQIKSRMSVVLSTAQFFHNPTISGLAQAVDDMKGAKFTEVQTNGPLVLLRRGQPKRSVLFVPGGWGDENEILVFAALVRRIETRQSLYAVRSHIREWTKSDTVKSHSARVADALRLTGIDAGLTIIGECAASTVALAIYRELSSRRSPPIALILLDPGDTSHMRNIEARISTPRNGQPAISKTLPPQVARYYAELGHLPEAPISAPLHIVLSQRFMDAEKVRSSWQPLAAAGLSMHRVPGDHNSYLREMSSATAGVLDSILLSHA